MLEKVEGEKGSKTEGKIDSQCESI